MRYLPQQEAGDLMLTACVSTMQAWDVKPAGFLGAAASQLKKGQRGEEALLVYHKAGTHWASYDKIIIDPITIWSAMPSTIPADQLADYQKLVNDFQITLTEKLARSYAIVDAAQVGALRIQAAIVNGSQASAVLKAAKTVAPYATVADVLWTFATGKPAFAGEVSIEYMIKDSETGELLAAGGDRRVGGNQLRTATVPRGGG